MRKAVYVLLNVGYRIDHCLCCPNPIDMISTVYTYLQLCTHELVKKFMRITLPMIGLFKIWMAGGCGIEVIRI